MAGFLDDMMAKLPPSLGEMFQPTPSQPLAPTPIKWYNAKTPQEQFLSTRDTSWADPLGGVTPYYPQKRYLEKNLAPNLDVSNFQLEALAQAGQEAVKNGLMTRKQADRMLPTLLTEGATGITSWGYPDTPKYQKILSKAELPPSVEEINALRGTTPYDDVLKRSRLMHAVMGAKIDKYGDGDLAYERWNGKGKTDRGADATNHIRKVKELEVLLKDPKNKALMDKWQEYTQRHAGKNPPPNMGPAPEDYTWADENVPAVVGNLLNALPSNPIPAVQRAVRNWTAPSMVPEEHPHTNLIRDLFRK